VSRVKGVDGKGKRGSRDDTLMPCVIRFMGKGLPDLDMPKVNYFSVRRKGVSGVGGGGAFRGTRCGAVPGKRSAGSQRARAEEAPRIGQSREE